MSEAGFRVHEEERVYLSDARSALWGRPLASKVTKSSNSSGQAGGSSSGAGVTLQSWPSGSARKRRPCSAGGPEYPQRGQGGRCVHGGHERDLDWP